MLYKMNIVLVLLKLALILLLFDLISCVKPKLDSSNPLQTNLFTANSSIKIFNLSNITSLSINNTPLLTTSGPTSIGSSLLPTNFSLGIANLSLVTFTIPYSLLNKDGSAHLNITYLNPLTNTLNSVKDTTLYDSPNQPYDYYYFGSHFLKLVRSVTSVNSPQDIKIRIVNFGTQDSIFSSNANGSNSKTKFGTFAPLTLTYSDGSPVSSGLSNIPPGQSSSYTEIPYGTYQFKLFANNSLGKIDYTHQLYETGKAPLNYSPDGFSPVYQSGPQIGYSPLIRTFKPGGSYTIFVLPNYINIDPGDSISPITGGMFGASAVGSINEYRTLTDNSLSVNYYFGKIQAVNAFPNKTVRFTIDDAPINWLNEVADTIPFAMATEVNIYTQGTHTVKVYDLQGNLLIEQSLTLSPYDHYTAWFINKSGQAYLSFSSVDYLGTTYLTGTNFTTDDGNNGSLRVSSGNGKNSICRFLNMSADIPYVTFTNDAQLFTSTAASNVSSSSTGLQYDTLIYQSASVNLPQGQTVIYDPYISFQYFPFQSVHTNTINSFIYPAPQIIRAYASSIAPNVQLPGALLTQISPITPSDFIANPGIYSMGNPPNTETGVFTIALIGNSRSSNSTDKARFFILKHNK